MLLAWVDYYYDCEIFIFIYSFYFYQLEFYPKEELFLIFHLFVHLFIYKQLWTHRLLFYQWVKICYFHFLTTILLQIWSRRTLSRLLLWTLWHVSILFYILLFVMRCFHKINYKKEIATLQWINLVEDNTLAKWSKLMLPVMVPPVFIQWEGHIALTLWYFCQKVNNLNIIMRRHQKNPFERHSTK